jgi:tRNA A37 N6-isopentenylltransferase MiaA
MKTIKHALVSLYANAKWTLSGTSYPGLDWLDENITKPSEQELLAEIARLNQQWTDTEYQRLRQVEYPPITDYLDGVVKGDQQQIAGYIAACLAVKAKYPKPE